MEVCQNRLETLSKYFVNAGEDYKVMGPAVLLGVWSLSLVSSESNLIEMIIPRYT